MHLLNIVYKWQLVCNISGDKKGDIFMRIGVISDIHANAVALKAVLKHMEGQRIDKIIFLGDLAMNGPYPKETMDIINDLSPAVWIRGNTDYWFHEVGTGFTPKTEKEQNIYALWQYASGCLNKYEIELLLSKPERQHLKVDNIDILCVHGSHRSNSEPIGIMCPIECLEQLTSEIDADVLLCGHTHLPYYASFNGKKIINPGSVSISLDGEAAASYGILEVNQGVISYTNYKVPYDIKQVLIDAANYKFPNLDRYSEKLINAR